jgi:hypothetical protein
MYIAGEFQAVVINPHFPDVTAKREVSVCFQVLHFGDTMKCKRRKHRAKQVVVLKNRNYKGIRV